MSNVEIKGRNVCLIYRGIEVGLEHSFIFEVQNDFYDVLKT